MLKITDSLYLTISEHSQNFEQWISLSSVRKLCLSIKFSIKVPYVRMVTKNMVTFVEIIIFFKFWSQTSYNIAVYVVWRFVVFSLHGWATASFMRWNIGGSPETKYKSSIYVCYNTFHCHKNVIKSSAPFMVTLGASLDKKRTKKLLIKKKKKKYYSLLRRTKFWKTTLYALLQTYLRVIKQRTESVVIIKS